MSTAMPSQIQPPPAMGRGADRQCSQRTVPPVPRLRNWHSNPVRRLRAATSAARTRGMSSGTIRPYSASGSASTSAGVTPNSGSTPALMYRKRTCSGPNSAIW